MPSVAVVSRMRRKSCTVSVGSTVSNFAAALTTAGLAIDVPDQR